jgi:hypothetical protein
MPQQHVEFTAAAMANRLGRRCTSREQPWAA